MNVLVSLEHHFLLVGNQAYCRLLPANFCDRYLSVWDEVVIVARANRSDTPPPDASPLDLHRVRMAALPDYLVQFDTGDVGEM